MIYDLKPYDNYREPAHPWLGQVPAHWTEKRAKYFFREIDERSVTGNEEMLSVSHKNGVIPRPKHVTMFKAESNVGHKICFANDIVINTMWAFMGAMGVARQTGIVSPSYGVYRLINHNELHPEYVDRLIRLEDYKSEYLCRSTGIRSSRLRLYPDQFLCIPIICPPPEEQAAIVRFLNQVDHRIGRYIRAKRQLIALLNEQKQAIIHRAVTRGLDPNVKLKDSSFQWLGQVPEHWTLKRFKFCTRISSGQVDPRDPRFRNEVLIAPNHIQSGTGTIIKEETAFEQGVLSGKYQVAEGQIIYSKIRPNLRKAVIAPRDCLCSADMYAITPSSEAFVPQFFLHLLLSHPVTQYAIDCSMRVAMPKINREALGECWLCYPPKSEQSEILSILETELVPYVKSLTRMREEIELMQEYQTVLIKLVTTGQVDVRDAANSILPQVEIGEEGLIDLSYDSDVFDTDLDLEQEEVEA